MKMFSVRIVDGNSPHCEHGFTLYANSSEEVYLHVRGKEAPKDNLCLCKNYNNFHVFYDGDVVEVRENNNFDYTDEDPICWVGSVLD